MRILRIFLWGLLILACGSARADMASPAGIPPLPPTALGSEPVGNSGGPTVVSPNTSGPAQPQGLDYPRVLAALGIVVGLIFVLRWVGRFFFPAATGRARNRAVEVLSRSPLSPKQQVMLLRVGQRLIVVGDSGSQMNPLCEITDPDEVAALVGQLRDEKIQIPKRAFGSLFGRSRHAFETDDHPPATATSELREAEENDPPVATAREELSGLRDRVRLLAEQFKGA
jgi:flagellar biogenesis protein FliO